MEAISKKSGRKFTGKIATLMLRIGVAKTCDGSEYVRPKKAVKSKAKKVVKQKVKK